MARGHQVKVVFLGDEKPLRDSIDKTGKAVEGLGTKMTGFAQALGGAFATQKIIGFAKTSIRAAGDIGETMSKTEELFGDASTAIFKFADGAAKNLGQSRLAAMEAATDFAVFGKAAGKTGLDLANFSTGLVELSSDLASFHNTKPEQAVYALGAALRGEFEPARRYGFQLDAITIANKAVEMGLIESASQIDKQSKTLAAAALLHQEAGDAVGDFARTSDSATNAQRILAAQFEDTKVAMGEALMPMFELALNVITPLIEAFNNLDPTMQNIILISGVMAAGFVAVTNMVAGFQRSMSTLSSSTRNGAKILGGLAIALEAVAIGYALWRGEQQKNAQLVNDITGSIERQINALLQAEDAYERVSTRAGGLAEAEKAVLEAFKESGYVTDDLKDGLGTLALSQDELMEIIKHGEAATESWIADQIHASGVSRDLAESIARVINEEDSWTEATLKASGATEDWLEDNKQLAKAFEEVDDAAENFHNKDDFGRNLRKGMLELAQTSDDLTMELLRTAAANMDVALSSEKVSDWTLIYEESVRLLATAQEEEKRKAEEAAEANARQVEINKELGTGYKEMHAGLIELHAAAGDHIDDGERIRSAYKEAAQIYRDNVEAIEGLGNRYSSFDKVLGDVNAGEIDLLDANLALSEQFRTLPKRIDENSRSLDQWTEEGGKNIKAIIGTAEAIKTRLSAELRATDGNYAKVRTSAEYWTEALRAQMSQLGFNQTEVDEYIKLLGLTPEQIQTTIKLSRMEEAKQNVQIFNTMLDDLPDDVRAEIVAAIDGGDWIRAWDLLQRSLLNAPMKQPVVPDYRRWPQTGGLRPPGGGGLTVFRSAHGGMVEAGQPLLVGDRGSRGELFVPSTSGRIVPDYDIPDMVRHTVETPQSTSSRSAGWNTTVEITVNAGVGANPVETGRQIVRVLDDYYRAGGTPPKVAS